MAVKHTSLISVMNAKRFDSTNNHQALLYKHFKKCKYNCNMQCWLVRCH